MRLLLVEDSVALADELLPRLKQAGYAVDWLADGRDASRRAGEENYDIAVLDLGLPGRNGLEVLHDWRTAGLALPVLVLTARDSFADRIAGLRAGADDYLAKPFHPDELLLRLQALLRRHHGHSNAPRLVVGALALDEERQLVERERHGGGAERRRVPPAALLHAAPGPRALARPARGASLRRRDRARQQRAGGAGQPPAPQARDARSSRRGAARAIAFAAPARRMVPECAVPPSAGS